LLCKLGSLVCLLLQLHLVQQLLPSHSSKDGIRVSSFFGLLKKSVDEVDVPERSLLELFLGAVFDFDGCFSRVTIVKRLLLLKLTLGHFS
jgi:hypothetical protein